MNLFVLSAFCVVLNLKMEYNKYMAFKCKLCGVWQGKQNTKWRAGLSDIEKSIEISNMMIKCKSCGRSYKFLNRIRFSGVAHTWFNNPVDASNYVRARGELRRNENP